MRRYIANDRRIANEVTAANVDAPERATYVETDTAPTSPTDLEVGCEAGTVVVDGDTVSVSAQTEAVSDISGQVAETAYRYHTLSVDATGTLVVRSSPVGEFDANDSDAEPITQVTEPEHDTGEVFIGTAFQVGGAIERVFDGRYFGSPIPSGVITMWSGAISDIPAGWALCDGSDGTPDLRNRFITGAGDEYTVDDTGGEKEHQLTESELPDHSHSTDGNTGTISDAQTGGSGVTNVSDVNDATIGSTGDDAPHENRPPFYALAYIQKV